jgi:O-acetyl-ADP-ribose deacetylase (regulator of RNase III)
MIIREEQRDLFTVPTDYILVHCISADLAMGAGIAKEFTRRGVKAKLQRDYQDDIEDIEVGDCLVSDATDWRCEFSFVTKEKYWQKPTYETMRMALEDAKDLCEETIRNGYTMKLAMPRIGCGLDRLQWVKVKEIIEEVFADTDVEILVCVK